MDLGLDQLTDDQLVELLRAVCQEGAQRSLVCHAAMQQTILDEAERSRIGKAAAEAEARRIRLEEERRVAEEAARKVRAGSPSREQQTATEVLTERDRMTTALGSLPGSGRITITAWKHDVTNEKRVYLDTSLYKFRLDITGSAKYAPGTLTVMEGGEPRSSRYGNKPLSRKAAQIALDDWQCDLAKVMTDFGSRWVTLTLVLRHD